MSVEPDRRASQDAEIISFSGPLRPNRDLERAFQESQARLIQFLTYRLGSEAEAQERVFGDAPEESAEAVETAEPEGEPRDA